MGKKAKEGLAKHGITTVAQLASLTDDAIDRIAADVTSKGLSKRKLTAFRQEAGTAKQTNAPEGLIVDHRKADNPYESRYGEGWKKQQVKDSYMLKAYVDIRDMVRHICKKSEELMKGTKHEDNWFFYHDALSLMKAQDTKAWMEEEGILKHWILPEHDLNRERPRYKGHPVGNSPEFMPLDCSLNKDLDDELWRHILYTRFLEEEDPRKFSISTPLRGSSAIRRVWENSVPNERIKQDVYKVLTALPEVYKAKGCIVPNLGNRNGRRALESNAARVN